MRQHCNSIFIWQEADIDAIDGLNSRPYHNIGGCRAGNATFRYDKPLTPAAETEPQWRVIEAHVITSRGACCLDLRPPRRARLHYLTRLLLFVWVS